jgi:hypothetical protein
MAEKPDALSRNSAIAAGRPRPPGEPGGQGLLFLD